MWVHVEPDLSATGGPAGDALQGAVDAEERLRPGGAEEEVPAGPPADPLDRRGGRAEEGDLASERRPRAAEPSTRTARSRA